MANEPTGPVLRQLRKAAALIAVAGVAFSTACGDSPAGAAGSGHRISAAPRSLSGNFSLFRSPPERMPSEPAAKILAKLAAIPPLAAQGFNPSLAQRAGLPGTKRVLWVIPGRAYIVITEGGASMDVCSVKRAMKHGCGLTLFVRGTSKPRLMWSQGIVPDGVTSVRVSKTAFAPVRANAFARMVNTKKVLANPVLIRKRWAQATSAATG